MGYEKYARLENKKINIEDRAYTDKELLIIAMLARGYERDEISKKLFLSVDTVKTHIHNIYTKYGCSRRSCLVASYILGYAECRHKGF